MDQLIGLVLSFLGVLLLSIALETKENPIFEFSLVLGIPMIYFGLRMLVSI